MDNSIIEKANLLIRGQGDGRISEEDMNELLKEILTKYDSQITNEQVETLIYVYTNYNLTEPAKKKVINLFGVSMRSSLNCISQFKPFLN